MFVAGGKLQLHRVRLGEVWQSRRCLVRSGRLGGVWSGEVRLGKEGSRGEVWHGDVWRK